MKPARLLLIAVACFGGPASSQQSESRSPPGDAPITASDELERCFNVPGFVDFSVLNDRHIYFRTRGGNHYLITTEHCENLERSYHRGTARLVPYGRQVCQDDGSHVVYDDRGREAACSIRTIERVRDRAEARRLAREIEPLVEIEQPAPAE